MNFEALWETICEEAAKLWAMIFDPEITPEQEKVRDALESVTTVLGNLFFTGLVLVFAAYGIRVLVERHPWIVAFLDQARKQLSFVVAVTIALGAIALVLMVLRGLLHVYKFIRATDLTKLYFFVELVHLALQAWRAPGTSPTPFLFDALKKLLGVD